MLTNIFFYFVNLESVMFLSASIVEKDMTKLISLSYVPFV